MAVSQLDPGAPAPAGPSGARRRPAPARWALSALSATWPILIVAVGWELFARSGQVPAVLAPSLGDIFGAMVRMADDGVLLKHVFSTLARLFAGFSIAAVIGSVIGMSMARWRLSEAFFQPLLAALMPIPGLAWVPIFILWFGLGNGPTITLVAFVSTLPISVNVWTGVKSANPVWLRAAQSMDAAGAQLFWKVILPAGLPFLLTGLRIGLAQSWRTVVAGEFIANTTSGLGWVIFNSIAFLQSDVMFASIILIALTGLFLERVLIAGVERRTVRRWGMLQDAGSS